MLIFVSIIYVAVFETILIQIEISAIFTVEIVVSIFKMIIIAIVIVVLIPTLIIIIKPRRVVEISKFGISVSILRVKTTVIVIIIISKISLKIGSVYKVAFINKTIVSESVVEPVLPWSIHAIG